MLEPIAEADIFAIVALMNRAYRAPASVSSWTSEVGYIAGDRTNDVLVRETLTATPAGSLLKWTDGESDTPIGCVWLEPCDQATWYLGSLAVDPDHQQRGCGKSLLAAAEQWVRMRGGMHIRMTVINIRAALVEWYVRRGYHLTGETEAFPYGDDRFGTPMRDDLAFVVLVKDLEGAGVAGAG